MAMQGREGIVKRDGSETPAILAGKGEEAMMDGDSCREGEEVCEERGSETSGGLAGKEREIVDC